MTRKESIDISGALFLILCSMLMGANQVAIKLVNASIHPVFQAGLRSAIAFLPMLIYALLMRKKLSVVDGSFWPGIVAGCFFATEFFLLFQALSYTSVSRASIFFYTMPFWAAIGAHLLIPGERITPIRAAGLILAFGGVIIALLGASDIETTLPDAIIGDLYCLVGGMLWAGIVLITRCTRFSKAVPEMQLLYQLFVSALVLLSLSLFFTSPARPIDATIIALFLFQVFVVVCFGFLLWFWLLSIYPASDVASYSFLSPVFGVLFGWLILSETIDWSIIAALIMVSAGVYLVNRRTGSVTDKSP